MSTNENKLIPPKNLEEYLGNRLDRLFEQGKTLEHIQGEFDMYDVPYRDRFRMILNSEFGKDEKIKGVIELFGYQACQRTALVS